MDFTDFTFRVLLIFLPGIITTVLINRNTNTKDESSIQFFMRALMYGFISYYILMFIYFILNQIILLIVNNSTINYSGEIFQFHLKFFDIMNDSTAKMDFTEIFLVSLVSVVVACIKSSYENNILKMSVLSIEKQNLGIFAKIVNWYHKFWVKQNVFTEKSDSADVWRYLLTNLNNIITVRDWENKLAYVGTLRRCSPSHKETELFLEDVSIADMTGVQPIRDVTAVYLCKDNADSWDIEFMYMDTKEAISKFNLNEYNEYDESIKPIKKLHAVRKLANEISASNTNNVNNEKVNTSYANVVNSEIINPSNVNSTNSEINLTNTDINNIQKNK